MQSSSRIPRLINDQNSGLSSEMEDKNDEQETRRKVSLTDQGKAAKLLRKRLAFALATNTRSKSDSGTSASETSDQETAVKELKVREERKSSIPRKISEENAKKLPQAKQLLGAMSEKIKTNTRERNRKFANVSLPNGAGNSEHKENFIGDLQKQEETKQNSTFVKNKNKVVSKNSTAESLSREPAAHDFLLPTIHEQATKNSEDAFGSQNLHSLDTVESELFKLKADVDKTLKDFLGINKEAERMKMKLQELRRQRIDYGTREAF